MICNDQGTLPFIWIDDLCPRCALVFQAHIIPAQQDQVIRNLNVFIRNDGDARGPDRLFQLFIAVCPPAEYPGIRLPVMVSVNKVYRRIDF